MSWSPCRRMEPQQDRPPATPREVSTSQAGARGAVDREFPGACCRLLIISQQWARAFPQTASTFPSYSHFSRKQLQPLS